MKPLVITLLLSISVALCAWAGDEQGSEAHRRNYVTIMMNEAKQGKAEAQLLLGVMYEKGIGLAKDEAEAVTWYRKAAEQGSADAQSMLGLVYADGRGVARNEGEAMKWFRKAEEGRGGLPKDKAEAMRFYRKAAEQTAANLESALTFSLMQYTLSIAAHKVQDVTAIDTFNGEDIWKSYKRDGIYQLKRNLLYGKIFNPERDEYELFPPWAEPGAPKSTRYSEPNPKTGEYVELIPESIEAFNDDPAKWGRIKGVIPKGTKLRMSRVIFEQTIETHVFYYIAVFVDGPFAGKPVLLSRISTDGYGTAQSYNSDYLEQVNAP